MPHPRLVSTDELLSELFGLEPHDDVAVTAVAGWLATSRRFASFVEEQLPKVRKKLRMAGDAQGTLEVLFELEVAFRVLSVKAHGLAYEPFAAAKERGPDFAVTFNGRPWFLLEVTRSNDVTSAPQRLARSIIGKLGQLRSEGPNVVLVGVEGAAPAQEELSAVMVAAVRAAEAADQAYFARLGLRDRKQFFQRYDRLAAVMLRDKVAGGGTGGGLVSWFNPRARRRVESRGLAALLRALAE